MCIYLASELVLVQWTWLCKLGSYSVLCSIHIVCVSLDWKLLLLQLLKLPVEFANSCMKLLYLLAAAAAALYATIAYSRGTTNCSMQQEAVFWLLCWSVGDNLFIQLFLYIFLHQGSKTALG